MEKLENVIIDTIYIGGGTPSYINEKYIYDILNIELIRNKTKKNAEITIEINPGTINKEKLECYKNSGINRISVGLQSTNNELLRNIGRIHKYEEFLSTYNMIRKAGFNNVNIDLMLALPGQNLAMLQESVEKVIKLNPEHISIYSLILEENTKLFEMVNKGNVSLPDDDKERQMYWKTKKMLEDNNYKHYEISNFSKEGYESKHNMNCWEQKEYLGFGVAAHSYFDNKRFSNTISIEEYINNIKENKIERNITINEIQNVKDKEKEYVLLGLRKIEGININKFKEKFGEDCKRVFEKEFNILLQQGLIKIKKNNIVLSNSGLDFANLVWEKFV